MTQIEVKQTDHIDRYEFRVTIRDAGGQTEHGVTLKRNDYERISGGKVTPQDLVRESFRFLLEREPKEAILGSFDLTVIGRYFPEFEREIKKQL